VSGKPIKGVHYSSATEPKNLASLFGKWEIRPLESADRGGRNHPTGENIRRLLQEGAAMSHRAVQHVLKFAKARGVERLVLVVLADHCNGKRGDFIAWPSLDVLERETLLRQSSICRVLTHLEAIGDIRRERSNGGRNKRTRYVITVSEKHSPTETVKHSLSET